MLSTEMKERNRSLQASLGSPSLTSLQVSACLSLTLPLGSQGKGHANGVHGSVSEREKEGILNDLRLLSERHQPESHDKVTCCSNGGCLASPGRTKSQTMAL